MFTALQTVTRSSIIVIFFVALCSSRLVAEAHQFRDSPPAYVVNHYIESAGFPEKGEYIERSKLSFKRVDINGDNKEDWFVTDVSNCGSSGCTGYIYLNSVPEFCHVGKIHEKDLYKKEYPKLKCGEEKKILGD